MMTPFSSFLLLLLLHGCRPQEAADPAPLDSAAVRAVLAEAMRCQNLSRLHAAVVFAGRELNAFRLELLPDGTAADIGADRTLLLPIASVSKGMFATALPLVQAQLRRDRGDPGFDLLTTPIKQLLGDNDFWFLDHWRTESVTIEDLTSHTTGLNRHDSLSILAGVQSKLELVQRVGRFNATGAYRGSFIYNNLVWTIADLAVQRLTGRNFSDYMRVFLWQPLGMSRAVSSSEMDAAWRLRQTARPLGLRAERTDLERSVDLVEAAGGIYLPLEDMIKYMGYHTRSNYSSFLPPPDPFKAVNGFAAAQPAFNPNLFEASLIADLPSIDRESYGHGWFRSWYRDHLSYEHGGSFFGAHCSLRVLPKRRLSAFVHTALGASASEFQSAYAHLLGYYLTDMLLRNASFVTRSNVCSIFRSVNPGEPAVVPRRHLTAGDVETCTGSFGNYGFGTLSVTQNSSSGQLNLAYGTALMALVPVQLPGSADAEYSFFLTILRPLDLARSPQPIVDGNASHVTLRPGILQPQSPPSTSQFLRIWRQPADGRVLLSSPALESSALLEKGLRPDSWRRPELCKGAIGAGGRNWLLAAAAAVVVRALLRS